METTEQVNIIFMNSDTLDIMYVCMHALAV